MFEVFNGDISEWDTAKVTDMKEMFGEAEVFNRNLASGIRPLAKSGAGGPTRLEYCAFRGLGPGVEERVLRRVLRADDG